MEAPPQTRPVEVIEHPVERIQRNLQEATDAAFVARVSGRGRAMAHELDRRLLQPQQMPFAELDAVAGRHRTVAGALLRSYNGTGTRFGIAEAFPARFQPQNLAARAADRVGDAASIHQVHY